MTTAKQSPKDRAKDLRLRREFGISLAEYQAALKFQDHRCAVCKRLAKEFKNSLATDHDHKTGLVRGLLCWGCNKLIGVAQDDARRLHNASQYLQAPPMTSVLGTARYTAPGRIGTKRRKKLLASMRKP